MITIEYNKSNKMPMVNSIYISTIGMKQEVYLFLSNLSCAEYDKINKRIELSVGHLATVVKMLSTIDDVCIVNKCKQEEVTEETIPKKHKYKIHPYQHQIRAINYGLNHSGWLLLDDMGLGKTKTIIDLATVLKEQKKVKRCLVVCGVASLRYNWAREIEKNCDEDYCILGRKINSKGNEFYATVDDRIAQLKKGIDEFFTITNVETLQNSKFAEAFNKSKKKYDMIVFDEIHACKTPTSKSAKTLMKLKADYKVGLTGTIITSKPEDCFVPLKWTGNTKSNYTQFKNTYNVYGGFNNVEVIGHKNLPYLRQLLSTCALRRTKQSLLDLPPKNYYIEYVEMGKEQRRLYEEVRESVLQELDKLDHIPTTIEEITLNMRLRQITAYPGILSTTTNESIKMERCEQMVDDIISQGDKVVIFCSFKGAANEIFKRLNKYNPVLCSGDVSDIDIDNNINKFQEDENTKVFVGTWQRCGTGITLTSASYMIFIDTPWNDSDFQQACDRIYRIGQKKPVFIYTLITKGTYDERVQEIIERKEDLTQKVIV